MTLSTISRFVTSAAMSNISKFTTSTNKATFDLRKKDMLGFKMWLNQNPRDYSRKIIGKQIFDVIVYDRESLDFDSYHKDRSVRTSVTTLPAILAKLPLKELKINSMELTSLPEELSSNKSLEILSIRAGSEFEKLPDSFGKFENLKELYLDCFGLKNLPRSFGKLSNLERLSLDISQQMRLTESFGNLQKLGILKCWIKDLEQLPTPFWNLRNLKKLELSCGNMVSLPKYLGDFTQLEELKLYGKKLESLPNVFDKLKNLKTLEIHAPKITQLPDSIGELSNLENLNLARTPLRCLPPTLKQFKNLKQVTLELELFRSLFGPHKLFEQTKHIEFLGHKMKTTFSFMEPGCVEINRKDPN